MGLGGSREFNLPRRPPNFSAWTFYHDFQLPLEAALFWRTANGQPSRFPPWGKDDTIICATAPSSLWKLRSQEDEANIPVTLRQTWVPAPSRYSSSPLLEIQLGLLGHHKQGVMPALAAMACPFMPRWPNPRKDAEVSPPPWRWRCRYTLPSVWRRRHWRVSAPHQHLQRAEAEKPEAHVHLIITSLVRLGFCRKQPGQFRSSIRILECSCFQFFSLLATALSTKLPRCLKLPGLALQTSSPRHQRHSSGWDSSAAFET